MQTVEYYKGLISEAQEEYENCRVLNGIIGDLGVSAANCAIQLESVYGSLSAGLYSESIGAGISKILDRANAMKQLQTLAEQAQNDIRARMTQLEEDIEKYEELRDSAWKRFVYWLNNLKNQDEEQVK